MTQRFANNFSTTLDADLASTDTSMVLFSVTGLPTLAARDSHLLTIQRTSDNAIEIVKVLANPTGTTLPSIARAQEGTPALNFIAGDVVELRDTAGTLAALTKPRTVGCTFDGMGAPLTLSGTTKIPSGPVKFTGEITSASIVSAIVSGSVTIGVKACDKSVYPASLVDITGGHDLVLTSAYEMEDVALTGWSLAISAGDIVEFELKAVDGIVKQVTALLTVE